MPKKLNKNKFSFWQKTKNFFSVDDSIFQEEVLHPNAERYKEKKISKNFIFLFILGFLILVNVLVGFNLNQFYIRSILGFLFIILVPGALIMLMLKIRQVGFWEYLVYTVGLSISFIMFAGLFVNWTLPFLHITDKPLQLQFILPIFDLILLIFWMIAYKRNLDLKEINLKIPVLDWVNNIFFIIPMLFPVLAILGAFLLNNHGPNILTMIMLGSIAVYVLLLVIFRKRLNPNIYPWAIWMISLALLLSFSMRSWYVSGWDLDQEYQIFKINVTNLRWSFDNFKDAYNSCLSIILLPIVLLNFSNLTGDFAFKLLIPSLFSLSPAIIYLIFKNWNQKNYLSFIISFFFVLSPQFATRLSILCRQGIAILFFSLVILILFNKTINLMTKKSLFVTFGFSMIVSHYSTAYIALAIFVLTFIFIFIYQMYENRKIEKGRLMLEQREKFYLTGILILLLLIFGFLWYNQTTETSKNLINVLGKSFINLNNLLEKDLRQESAINAVFNIFYTKTQSFEIIKIFSYSESEQFKLDHNNLKFYSTGNNKKYEFKPVKSNLLPPTKFGESIPLLKNNLFLFLYYLRQISIKIIILFIFVGIVCLTSLKKKITLQSIFLMIVCFLGLVAVIILPIVSLSYDLSRVFQQVLIILAFPAIYGIFYLSNLINKKNKRIICTIVISILFLIFSGFIGQILGGTFASMTLNNFGEDYEWIYTSKTEMFGSKWLLESYNPVQLIFADKYADNRLKINGKNRTNKIINDIFLDSINKESYVYLSNTNLILEKTFAYINSDVFAYNFPTEFLNENKNKIYNNGGSEIFK